MTFVDVDISMAEQTGRTVRELWDQGDEPAYRQLESKVALDTLAENQDVVLAAPGGVVPGPAARNTLADAFVVWLRTDPTTLSKRVRHDDHRPLLVEHPLDVLTSLARDRSGLYEEIANLVVDTDYEDVRAIADRVLDAFDHRAQPA